MLDSSWVWQSESTSGRRIHVWEGNFSETLPNKSMKNSTILTLYIWEDNELVVLGLFSCSDAVCLLCNMAPFCLFALVDSGSGSFQGQIQELLKGRVSVLEKVGNFKRTSKNIKKNWGEGVKPPKPPCIRHWFLY